MDLAPTGFMLIQRQVFLKMIEAYPQSKITKMLDIKPNVLEWMYDFFPVYVDDGVLLSEDYGFCRRWRALGRRVWADPDVELYHIGRKAYYGRLRDLMQPVPSVPAAA